MMKRAQRAGEDGERMEELRVDASPVVGYQRTMTHHEISV